VTSSVYGGGRPQQSVNVAGRWPANVAHDGSDEVLAAFPEANGGHWSGQTPSLTGRQKGPTDGARVAEDGSAARFFYTAKADDIDRLGSKHPTVKPIDLMRWLCRLVTPPGGIVLDPFAGSGTTGVAAYIEGFDAILIEREAPYVADAERKLAWVRGEGRLTSQEAARSLTPRSEPRGPFFAEPDGEVA
jgi:site-specific DNA-methyltransferase (adenine-specific)